MAYASQPWMVDAHEIEIPVNVLNAKNKEELSAVIAKEQERLFKHGIIAYVPRHFVKG